MTKGLEKAIQHTVQTFVPVCDYLDKVFSENKHSNFIDLNIDLLMGKKFESSRVGGVLSRFGHPKDFLLYGSYSIFDKAGVLTMERRYAYRDGITVYSPDQPEKIITYLKSVAEKSNGRDHQSITHIKDKKDGFIDRITKIKEDTRRIDNYKETDWYENFFHAAREAVLYVEMHSNLATIARMESHLVAFREEAIGYSEWCLRYYKKHGTQV